MENDKRIHHTKNSPDPTFYESCLREHIALRLKHDF